MTNGINGCNGCFILHKNTPRRVSVTLRSVSNYAILITPPSAARRCTQRQAVGHTSVKEVRPCVLH